VAGEPGESGRAVPRKNTRPSRWGNAATDTFARRCSCSAIRLPETDR